MDLNLSPKLISLRARLGTARHELDLALGELNTESRTPKLVRRKEAAERSVDTLESQIRAEVDAIVRAHPVRLEPGHVAGLLDPAGCQALCYAAALLGHGWQSQLRREEGRGRGWHRLGIPAEYSPGLSRALTRLGRLLEELARFRSRRRTSRNERGRLGRERRRPRGRAIPRPALAPAGPGPGQRGRGPGLVAAVHQGARLAAPGPGIARAGALPGALGHGGRARGVGGLDGPAGYPGGCFFERWEAIVTDFDRAKSVRKRAIELIDRALTGIEEREPERTEGIAMALAHALAVRALAIQDAPVNDRTVGQLAEKIILALHDA